MKKIYKSICFILLFAVASALFAPANRCLASDTGLFQVKQVDTKKFNMIFDADTTVKASELTIAVVINGEDAALPIKSVTSKANITTVELYGPFLEGYTYRVTYKKQTGEFVGSIGEIDKVSFNYWTDTPGDNMAYVNTEIEPAVVTLVPQLFNAMGVDITDRIDLDALEVRYTLLSDSEGFDLYNNELICEKPGTVSLEIKVLYTAESGEFVEKTGIGTVIVQKRTSLSFTLFKAGFICTEDFEYGAQNVFTSDADSSLWKKNQYRNSWVLGDKGTLQFGALVTDNRGNTLVTGINEYGNYYPENEEGERLYPYGYFKFVSANDEIVDIDEDGTLSVFSPGTAAVIIYFVDMTGIKEKELFVGASVITVKPERYAETFAFSEKSITVASETVDTANSASFVLTAFDQYGDAIALKNGAADIKVELMKQYEDTAPALNVFAVESSQHILNGQADCTAAHCGNSKGGVHYHIDVNGNAFQEYVQESKGKSVRYTVTVNQEENSRLVTNNTATIKLTVQNTAAEVEQLQTNTATKYYYSSTATGSALDLAVTYTKDYVKTGKEATVKQEEIPLFYLDTQNGLALKKVPKDCMVKFVKNQKTGKPGVIYYEITAPKSAKNWNYTIENGKITLKWNSTAGNSTLKYATVGTYTVKLYYARNAASGKLGELGTFTYEVVNTQAEPKLDVYASKLDCKTSIPLDKNSALSVVKDNLKFSLDGELIDWNNPGYSIKLKSYTVTAHKLQIKTVDITVPIDDGDAYTNYSYTKTLTLNKTIYYEPPEE